MTTPQQHKYTAADGATNVLTVYPAQNAPDKTPIVFFLPAMAIPARKYDQWCRAIAAQGIPCATTDLRGVGESSVRASKHTDFSYLHSIELDIPAALSCLKQEIGATDIIISGHSLGGQLAALYCGFADTQPQLDSPKGLVLVASCSIYYQRWPLAKSWQFLAFTQFSSFLAGIIGYFPGNKIGFGGTEARSLIADWARNARTGEYHLRALLKESAQQKSTKPALVDYDAKLSRVLCPILSLNFKDDSFAPAAATNHLIGKLKPRSLKRITLNRYDIGATRADHYTWMKSPTKPASIVYDWIKAL